MNKIKLQQQLKQFFLEDIGDRDLSSSIFSSEQTGKLALIAKDEGIFCGEEIIRTGFSLLVDQLAIEIKVHDGEWIEKGQLLAVIKGTVADLLQAERVVLNLVQRMSGIATKTKEAVTLLNSDHTKICDTRKTTPGLRMLEKYAVRCGGGGNHRLGLYDAVMLKDNHIAFAGSIAKAVAAARDNVGHMVKIEVEVETRAQMLEAVEAQADVIMFDNRTPEEINMWIKEVPDNIVTEASGGITLEKLASYGETGVDYISLGFLTHSITALDISAKVTLNK
ncbi:carboxylating nicotinate-nucleotide diphosphorylase [Lederbergia galactosidilytica]|uniref:Probable nicotinate-nucleotide pyrophosphorylase [carboxylating] n=1 Tax=Lederbergia galactosidilytica TaxID=217031 RepID=A0A0Q9Y7R8_9BACI|nr:carboxylating nicotinate-nucleotide diphosphorylase [Lederbergia galactosidilytica]KRG12298.1 nicotinate-nucleotide pyrophosphorylase [Virgibacillus soli]KRG13086.1 nicotinate-nucleotide pyrophosphorylase [Lederbergia galactosidilytica]MBP1913894.1 nicotinate-nucleotide pyrophosphorylase (carboxylating) [Lederbergia galactosidilytica]OAK73938.1 nicotinate-nucleotide pyrophosphorylase [Lederbergia galactosidilytica]